MRPQAFLLLTSLSTSIALAQGEQPANLVDNKRETNSQPYGVSSEISEERNFGDVPQRIFALSKEPLGKKCLSLVIDGKGHPVLRFYGSLKEVDNLRSEDAQTLLGKKMKTADSIDSELYGWNGMRTERFRIIAKIENKRVVAYKVFGPGVSDHRFQLVKKGGE
jgi:hypothetical protein